MRYGIVPLHSDKGVIVTTALTAPLHRDDIATLRAMTATYAVHDEHSTFPVENEAIEAIVYSHDLQDEWFDHRHRWIRCEHATPFEVWQKIWDREQLNFVWLHDGIGLSFSSLRGKANPDGSIMLVVGDIEVYGTRGHFRQPIGTTVAITMHDLTVPSDVIDYLTEQLT